MGRRDELLLLNRDRLLGGKVRRIERVGVELEWRGMGR